MLIRALKAFLRAFGLTWSPGKSLKEGGSPCLSESSLVSWPLPSKVLTGPFKALMGPYKDLKGLYKALKGICKALEGPRRPWVTKGVSAKAVGARGCGGRVPATP